MTAKRDDINTDYVISEYQRGISIAKIAEYFSCSYQILYDILRRNGIKRVNRRPKVVLARRRVFPLDEAIMLYHQGVSIKKLSERFSVDRGVITRGFKENGIYVRGRKEAEILKWSQASPEKRIAQTLAAHTAWRGARRSVEDSITLAASRQKIGRMTCNERFLFEMLRERNITGIPQQAIGIYNCDIGAFPVAVEIWGGFWHWYGEHFARTPERFRYLMNCGWHILVVFVEKRRSPLTTATADYVASYIQQMCRYPSQRREYRVIWSTGKTISVGSCDDDEIALIKPHGTGFYSIR